MKRCPGMKWLGFLIVAAVLLIGSPVRAGFVQLVHTSDLHYGSIRSSFRGQEKVPAEVVNGALVQAINSLPGVVLPQDGGVRAGQPVQWADAVIVTGDIASSMKGRFALPSTECWRLFEAQYVRGVTLPTRAGTPAEVLAVPGNHDVSDAIGSFKTPEAARDSGTLLGMYNRANGTSLAPEQFDARKQSVHLSREYSGVRVLLVQMWPDKAARIWLDGQLEKASGGPALLFTHAQPALRAEYFTNPNPVAGDAAETFENVVPDVPGTANPAETPVPEQREIAAFLQAHPSLVAWFHGHRHSNRYSTWRGPDKNLSLPVFQVDSPMKGKKSAKDETKLSFQLVSVDTDSRKLTVREVLWNSDPSAPSISWGESRTTAF